MSDDKCKGWDKENRICRYGFDENHPICWGSDKYPILAKINEENGYLFHKRLIFPVCCDGEKEPEFVTVGDKWHGEGK